MCACVCRWDVFQSPIREKVQQLALASGTEHNATPVPSPSSPTPHPPPHTPLSPPFPTSPSLKETGKNWLLMSVSVLLLLLLLLLLLVLLLDSSV